VTSWFNFDFPLPIKGAVRHGVAIFRRDRKFSEVFGSRWLRSARFPAPAASIEVVKERRAVRLPYGQPVRDRRATRAQMPTSLLEKPRKAMKKESNLPRLP
jgi:hypothetical protein